MGCRHLRTEERQTLARIADEAGIAEVLRVMGGLIRNAVPNVLLSWQDGSNDWANDASHALYKLAHQCYQRIDSRSGEDESGRGGK